MAHRTGFSSHLLVHGLLIVGLTLSCAGPKKLAEQSEKAYSQGELEKAYEKAAKALRKDPENARARAAMTQAAARIMENRKDEIGRMAAADTMAAAERALALDRFRRELLEYRVILPPDPAFDRDEAAIRVAAAERMYGAALEDLDSGYPKRAYDELQRSHAYRPDYRDVHRRIQQAYADALPRVALLPFSNNTDLPILSKEFTDRAYHELARRIGPPGYRFTELLPREQVYAAVPVSWFERINRREAARIGRDLGVDRVIVGRFSGVRSSTDTGDFTQTVYRKVKDKDETGAIRERYVEQKIDVLTRNRDLSVRFEYQVLDVEDGSPIVGNSGTMSASAHIVFTHAQPTGESGDYCLVSPEITKSDPDRAKRAESGWEERCGSWKVPELLERARKDRARVKYESRYREEFKDHSSARPVFLGDLPPEDDLAYVAFPQVWEPLLRTMRDLDQTEPRNAQARRP